jgi:hypothetical protein
MRERFQHRHAHGDAHLDLLADQALRAVGDRGVDLDAAVHRAGMHDQRVRLGQRELLLSRPKKWKYSRTEGTKAPSMRSRCSRSIMTMSASSGPSACR